MIGLDRGIVVRFEIRWAVLVVAFVACLGPACGSTNCTGCMALPQAGSIGWLYRGSYEGGLYPGGALDPPPAHAAAAVAASAHVVPRAPDGTPHDDGLIGLVSIGMSNAAQEFAAFEHLTQSDPMHSARVVLINGAVGGYTAADMAAVDAAGASASPYWQNLLARVAAGGLSPEQVQVAWIKVSDPAASAAPFPTHALELAGEIAQIARTLRAGFPNLRLAYLSSRTFGGFSSAGEPVAFETGLAVKWVIAAQITGDSTLAHGEDGSAAVAPVLLWGPYLWSDPSLPSPPPGTLLSSDFEPDGTHPSASGEAKVAASLAGALAMSTASAAWWQPDPGMQSVVLEASADAYVSNLAPLTHHGAEPVLDAGAGTAVVRFDLPSISGQVVRASLWMRVEQGAGGWIDERDPGSWTEAMLDSTTLPPSSGIVAAFPFSSREASVAVDVTASVNAKIASSASSVGFGIGAPPGGMARFSSRETSSGPRLVLLVSASP